MLCCMPAFPPFDPYSDPTSLAQRWTKWQTRFDNFLLAANIQNVARKHAMLLHYAGYAVHDIFLTLPDRGTDYGTAVAKLNAHFAPRKSVVYERHVFRQAKQSSQETVDQFQVRLRKLAATCEFANEEQEIVSQMIEGTNSAKLCRSALRERNVTLEKLMEVCRSLETAEFQATSMEGRERVKLVQKVTKKQWRRNASSSNQSEHTLSSNRPENKQAAKCSCCGGAWPHKEGKLRCPAWGATCHKCQKKNHFAKFCRQRPTVHSIDVTGTPASTHLDRSVEDCVFHVQSHRQELPVVTVKINDTPLEFCVDSRAGVNVIGEAWQKHLQTMQLEHTTTKLVPYGITQEISVMGKFSATFRALDQVIEVTVYIVKGTHRSLLSYKTASDLKLIRILQLVTEHSSVDAKKEFPKLFGKVGRLKNFQVKLNMSQDVQPVVRQHRRIPFHMRKALETELTRLEELDIIEIVTGPTPWVSPIVILPKRHDPNEVRMCVDMREANVAIARERHVMPTVEDVISILNGAAYFSKLDLKEDYHQLELAEESRVITTFSTHCGLRRYKRLLFGVNAAAEIFQDAIRQVLPDEDGIINVSDDILISGRTITEHDRRLRLVLKHLEDAGLTLNENKCVLGTNKLKFFGHVFSSAGVSVDPEKVKAVARMTAPKTPTEVRSLLGMVHSSLDSFLA
nr:uncharacterized protein K02A2.6-like [Dermacentor andersoni]